MNYPKNLIFSKKKATPLALYAVLISAIWQVLSPHMVLASVEITSAVELQAPAIASHPLLQQLRWQAASDNDVVEKTPSRFPQAATAKPRKAVTLAVSAYTSDVAQTDGDPCTTASGLNVCERNAEDIIATNYRYLPFGTPVRIPELFGDRVFYIHDRMNKRYTATVDVWMKDIADARKFGRQTAIVEIF
jgi:3D (Asp-Asp-Asp) domain-containing protein